MRNAGAVRRMKLRSGVPLWPAETPTQISARPPLTEKENCDIAIVGGGITGALMAHQLAENGLDVVVLEKRTVGAGSTAASTALLLYQTDTPLKDLVRFYDENKRSGFIVWAKPPWRRSGN